MRRDSPFFFFLIPFLVILIFLLGPIGFTILISFFDWSGGPFKFVGISNYINFFSAPYFQTVLINNLIWIAGLVFVPLAIGLVLAITLNEKIRGGSIFRTIIWLPLVISPVATSFMFMSIFDYHYGVLNGILRAIGLGNLARPWLMQVPLNTLCMIMTALWRTIGFSMLIYLSGLTALPREIREAATLDGSSGFHLLKNVTLPLLKPFTAVVLAWNMLGALTIFDYVQVMTAGGPARMSETLAVSMYRESFMLSHYGSGAAIAIVLFLLVIIVVVSLLHFSMKRELKY